MFAHQPASLLLGDITCLGQSLALKMSSSDSRQTRFANTNANARRPGNWGSDPAREYRPIGQRYGSVLVLSGPKVRFLLCDLTVVFRCAGRDLLCWPAPHGTAILPVLGSITKLVCICVSEDSLVGRYVAAPFSSWRCTWCRTSAILNWQHRARLTWPFFAGKL